MDGQSFDRWTRRFGSMRSRRGFLALGAVLLTGSTEPARAKVQAAIDTFGEAVPMAQAAGIEAADPHEGHILPVVEESIATQDAIDEAVAESGVLGFPGESPKLSREQRRAADRKAKKAKDQKDRKDSRNARRQEMNRRKNGGKQDKGNDKKKGKDDVRALSATCSAVGDWCATHDHQSCCSKRCGDDNKCSCRELGGSCQSNPDCCNGAVCTQGVCSPCVSEGQTCHPEEDCCCDPLTCVNEGGQHICRGQQTCNEIGETCSKNHAGCCPNLDCTTDGTDKCCRPSDQDCYPGDKCCNGGTCNPSTHRCEKQTCTPQCGGKTCGPDGCGGSCGTCSGNQTCSGGKCVCIPNCAGKSCGDDGCGGSCGTCSGTNHTCSGGQCVCTPNCSGKQCGDNACGGTCGPCGTGLICLPDFTCGQGTCQRVNQPCQTTHDCCLDPLKLECVRGQCLVENGDHCDGNENCISGICEDEGGASEICVSKKHKNRRKKGPRRGGGNGRKRKKDKKG